MKKIFLITLFYLTSFVFGQSWTIIQSTVKNLTIDIRFTESGSSAQPDQLFLTVGLPSSTLPSINIENIQTILFDPVNIQTLNYTPTKDAISWITAQKYRDLNTGILKVNPYYYDSSNNLVQISTVRISMSFNEKITPSGMAGRIEKALYRNIIVNWNSARYWLEKPPEKKTVFLHKTEVIQTFVPDTLMDSTLQADYIIISPDAFLDPAEELALHRSTSDSLKPIVARLKTIYKEFDKDGTLDPWEAIHSFIMYALKSWAVKPTFILLLGDGPNPVPTYPSSNSRGYSSDMRYVKTNPYSYSDPLLAIGRLPVATLYEAENVVEKIIDYESDPDIGLWRRRVTLIADDFARPYMSSIEITHTENNESIFKLIPSYVEVQKIYMEEYPIVKDGSLYGITKPAATEAVINQLEQGTVLLNYIGHGSPYVWAQEKLLSPDYLSSINTGMKLPIWVAATCNWGEYDLPEGNIFAEDILRMKRNGAIAVISSIEAITFSQNKQFVIQLFRNFFPTKSITKERLGIVFQTVQKDPKGNERFHLLGDPALKLALPQNVVEIDSVSPDPLKALSIGNYSGSILTSAPYQGDGFAILYDADRKIYRDSPYESKVIKYTLPGKTLFRGQILYTGNNYQGKFIIPKDVNFKTNEGRLTVYLYSQNDSELWEALGVKENLTYTGSNINPQDTDGPLISFASETKELEWGDHINVNSNLIIKLSDKLGINVTGEIGHDIRLWLDEDETNAINITDLFVYDPESYKSGTLNYLGTELSQGKLHITVEAWDNANNPSQKSISLNVTTETKLKVYNVFNFPNPFSTTTQFGFEINKESTVKIKIYTIAGRMIKVIDPMETYQNYSHIDWNGLDDFEDQIANGVYLYQLDIRSIDNGEKVTHIGKIAKYR